MNHDVQRHLEVEDTLLRLGGDKELLGELYEAFSEDAPLKFAELRKAAQEGDLDTCMKRAHSLKGAASAIGAEGVRDQAESVEVAAREGDLNIVNQQLAPIEEELHSVLKSIQDAL